MLVLTALLQPQRRENLALQEWTEDATLSLSAASESPPPAPPPAPAPPDVAVWRHPPAELAADALAELTASPR